jgi:hypothetical protein
MGGKMDFEALNILIKKIGINGHDQWKPAVF